MTEAARLATIDERLSPERWGAVVDRAIADAVDGDHRAREWLSRFVLPDPAMMAEAPEELAEEQRTVAELRRDPEYLRWLREQAVARDAGRAVASVARVVGRKA